ncbi:MAG TPA: CinA family protein [Nocardioides sp.]|nr:CinA family protein [Nocardioides sp.]
MASSVSPADLVPGLLVDLKAAGATVVTAESLTGGRVAAALTQLPGSSAVFRGGVVAYATDLKQTVLGVPAAVVAEHGVVSAECARAMAAGVRSVLGATYGIATTGVAGPDPQEGKAPGTVHVAVAGPTGVAASALELVGDRAAVMERTCLEALSVLSGMIGGDVPGEQPFLG